jgi:60 kDa SS-A/Ro ribonucleoprotein
MARRTDPLRSFSTRSTPQTSPASSKQVKNNAGGYTFEVTPETRIRRFLILGTEGGTYYVSQQSLTEENAQFVTKMAKEQPQLLLDTIRDVSVKGLAHRQQPTLFAFAAFMAHAPKEYRPKALEEFNAIVRTGTHLFLFLSYIRQFRGWGRLLRRAVAGWYLDRPVGALAYQMLKYRSREKYTHRDALRLAHPKVAADDKERQALLLWAVREDGDKRPAPKKKELPKAVGNFERLKAKPEKTLQLLRDNRGEHGLSWEMLPTETLNIKEVWKELLDSEMVPIGALVRQLPRLTRIGLLDDFAWQGQICRTITNRDLIQSSRIHPLSILIAQASYNSGRSKGDLTWRANPKVVDALGEAFHMAFQNVKPTGKRIRLALDVSGSMGWELPGSALTCRDGSTAMALATAKVEDPYSYDIVGFTGGYGGGYGYSRERYKPLTQLNISPEQRLTDAIDVVRNLPFGTTDCALPIIDAREKKLAFDAFVVYTDNETYQGQEHAHQALKRYRERMGIDAKLVVVGMTATNFTIADPDDPGMLDVVGFDASAPELISNFIRGGK